MEQLSHVVRRCDLAQTSRPFTRCMECNDQVRPVNKQEVVAMLEPETAAGFDEFWQCPDCNRIYWKGSHYARLQKLVNTVLAQTYRRV